MPIKITKNEKLANTIVEITEELITNLTSKTSSSTTIEGRKIIHEEQRGMKINKSFTMLFLNKELLKKIKMLRSYKLIYLISTELYPHCPLWFCNIKRTTQSQRALTELELLNVIIPIRGTGLYYVAPNMICKGNPINVNCALVIYLSKNRKKISDLRIEDVKSYPKPPNGYEIPFTFNNKIT